MSFDWLEESLLSAVDEGLQGNFARWLRFLGAQDGEWLELQALACKTGHIERTRFAHADSLGAAVALLENAEYFEAAGVFMIANQINPAAATRRDPRQWHDALKGASTTDRDIMARRLLFVDVDAVRPAGTSASQEEMDQAVAVGKRVYERLARALGSEAPLAYAHSGNGRQVFIALETMPESPEVMALIKGILTALGKLEGNDKAQIDPTVCDPKRLVPAFGTMKRKGAKGIAERPHRRTAMICAGEVKRASLDDLRRLLAALESDIAPAAPATTRPEISRGHLRLVHPPSPPRALTPSASGDEEKESPYKLANAVPVEEVAAWLGLLEDGGAPRCPGCGNTDGVAFVNNGLKCHHKSCADKGAPGRCGFRTPIDLVIEVQGCESRAAVNALAEQFGFKGIGRRKLSVEDYRIAWEACAKKSEQRFFPCTDTGNAERLAAHRGDRLRFCSTWDKWLVWDDTRWRLDELNRVHHFGKEVIRMIPQEADGISDRTVRVTILEHAERSEAMRGRQAIVRLAETDPTLTIRHSELDTDPWLLNCANGTIDLRTGQLHPHDRTQLLSKLVPIAYDPAAACPMWTAFLDRIMGGRAELVAFLQRAVGYTLTGQVGEQVLFFLHGGGSNGKSTLLRVLLDVLGDYGEAGAPDLLLAKHGEAHPTELADLVGKRLVVCQEVDAGRAFAEATVKQLTGGDIIKARRMHENFWQFAPTHKLFIAANHKPTVKGSDHAIWRRIRLIPFTVTIKDEEKDPELPQKLAQELPGILRWAVEGCLAWQREGLRPPAEVLGATDEYREEQDLFGAFLADVCEVGPELRVSVKELYTAYERWCIRNGEQAMTGRRVGDRMTDRGFKRAKSNGVRLYVGIGIRAGLGPSTQNTGGLQIGGQHDWNKGLSRGPEGATLSEGCAPHAVQGHCQAILNGCAPVLDRI
jgi:putative DNA primase/helicase